MIFAPGEPPPTGGDREIGESGGRLRARWETATTVAGHTPVSTPLRADGIDALATPVERAVDSTEVRREIARERGRALRSGYPFIDRSGSTVSRSTDRAQLERRPPPIYRTLESVSRRRIVAEVFRCLSEA